MLNTCKEGCGVYSLFNAFSSGLIYYGISHETRVFTKNGEIQVTRPIFHGKPLVSIAESNKDKRLDGSGIN